jgi:hypothetical protein
MDGFPANTEVISYLSDISSYCCRPRGGWGYILNPSNFVNSLWDAYRRVSGTERAPEVRDAIKSLVVPEISPEQLNASLNNIEKIVND